MKAASSPRLLLSSSALAVFALGCAATPAEEESVAARGDARLSAPALTPESGAPCSGASASAMDVHESIARIRSMAGLPGLRCDEAITTAAGSHCDYVVVNHSFSHLEQKGRPRFTGVHFGDRMVTAGSKATPGAEVLANIVGSATIESDAGFLNSVYHRAPFLRAETVAYGYGQGDSCATIDLAKTTAVEDVTVLWPPNGAVSVPTDFVSANETPNPVPKSHTVGSPVSLIRKRSWSSVRATLTGPRGPVATMLLTHANDPAGLVRDGEAHLIPLEPLQPETTYSATFVTNDTRASTTFTTRAR